MLAMLVQPGLKRIRKASCVFYPTCSEISSTLVQRLGDRGWNDGLGWMLQIAHTIIIGIPPGSASSKDPCVA